MLSLGFSYIVYIVLLFIEVFAWEFIAFLEGQWLLVTLLLGLLAVWFLLEKRNAVGVLEPQKAVFAINSNNYVVIDVRNAKNFHEGHILGSINIPYKEANFMQKITQYKNDELLLVCDRGMHSKAVAGQLKAKQIVCKTIGGGIEAWKIDGFPVKSQAAAKKIKNK